MKKQFILLLVSVCTLIFSNFANAQFSSYEAILHDIEKLEESVVRNQRRINLLERRGNTQKIEKIRDILFNAKSDIERILKRNRQSNRTLAENTKATCEAIYDFNSQNSCFKNSLIRATELLALTRDVCSEISNTLSSNNCFKKGIESFLVTPQNDKEIAINTCNGLFNFTEKRKCYSKFSEFSKQEDYKIIANNVCANMTNDFNAIECYANYFKNSELELSQNIVKSCKSIMDMNSKNACFNNSVKQASQIGYNYKRFVRACMVERNVFYANQCFETNLQRL